VTTYGKSNATEAAIVQDQQRATARGLLYDQTLLLSIKSRLENNKHVLSIWLQHPVNKCSPPGMDVSFHCRLQ